MAAGETSGPNYIDVISRPSWSNGSQTSSTQQKRVVAGKDIVKAEDINNVREIIDIMFNHSHTYTDNIGSC